jgi:hypothetical protein
MVRKAPNFGGKKLYFSGRTETLEQVFGKAPLSATEMPKKLWDFAKKNGLFK